MKYIKGLNQTSNLQEFTSEFTVEDLLQRPISILNNMDITRIEQSIKMRGDDAVREFTQEYDQVYISDSQVSEDEFCEIQNSISDELKAAILLARDNIARFHERQRPVDLVPEETSQGVYCSRQFRPIEKVGLYIPNGSAPLFSSLLMLAIPAIIAGCRDIKICTPPNKEGKVAPEILYVAQLLGITDIFKVGGAQAIFAMGYGTKKIGKVDKIFGPGSAIVMEAKSRVSSFCAIDMPAGPSEVLVIADKCANIRYVVADLLSQCEHGKDSQSILITNSEKLILEVVSECNRQVQLLSRKKSLESSLSNSCAILVQDIDDAIILSNAYGPEHLILQTECWKECISSIMNAGSVFCGAYSPESAGDYCSGTNHTLPTSGFARSYSGIGFESFGKWITFQEVTQQGLRNIGPSIMNMALAEGLDGHNNAVSIRLES